MSVLLSNFEYFIEKKFGFSTRVWVFIFSMLKLLLRVQTLGAKSNKKCCYVGILKAINLWTLGIGVKVERPNFCYLPIRLLDFLHLLTNRHRVKRPLQYGFKRIIFSL